MPAAPTTSPTTTAGQPPLADTVRGIGPLVLDWLDLRRRMLRTPGVQVAVRVRGELIVSGALGSADLDNGVDLRTDHLFRIASHSKTFAATTVMRLVARGELRLDDTVAAHLPRLAGTPLADRTVRELLGHQGGVIRDGDDCDYWQLMRPFPDAVVLHAELHQDDAASFGRNLHFKYSNYGYSLVGAIIERVTGRPFADVVRTEILDVLDLPRIHPDLGGPDAPHPDELACGHSLLLDGDDEHFVLRNPGTGAMAAATGFVANAEDLSAYACAHVMGDERLLDDTDKRLMQRTESIVTVEGTEQGRYGLGLELHTVGDRALVGHSGGFPGFVTRTFVDPKDGLVVSVLTNGSRGPAHELAVGVVKLIDLARRAPADTGDSADTAVSGTESAAADPADLPLWTTAGFGRTVIARLGRRLMLLHPDQEDPTADAIELTVEGPDRLRMAQRPGFGSAGEPVVITRSGDDPATGPVSHVQVGGMTAWPEAVFRARRREQMGRSARPGGSDRNTEPGP